MRRKNVEKGNGGSSSVAVVDRDRGPGTID